MDALELVRELVMLPGPPGQEEAVAACVLAHVQSLGHDGRVDAKGNVLVELPAAEAGPRIVVTAHLDEIALMVSAVEVDGKIRVVQLGGAIPWKWGEQQVDVLAPDGPLPGVLSFGCMHTNSQASVAEQGRNGPLRWDLAYVFTGFEGQALAARGVRPGTRVVLARECRHLREIGEHVAARFLDDRADLAAWMLALETLQGKPLPHEVVFAATAAEEVGGEGARYLMQRLQPDVCVALEIGPTVPESPFAIDATPTVWVNDGYAAMAARDIESVASVAAELGMEPHWQALSRGGSDASLASAHGLAARPVTLGFPVENSHGIEIMHRDAVSQLARLLAAYLQTPLP